MAYVTDNELGSGGDYGEPANWRAEFERFLRGVDLLIHEAMYFPPDSGHYRGHSHPVDVGEVARQTETKHLVLTHLQPETTMEKLLNDAATHFTRRMTMASDQMRLVV